MSDQNPRHFAESVAVWRDRAERAEGLLRQARHILRADEDKARSNMPWSLSFLDFLAEVDEHLRLIDGSSNG
jgi:hypothetical protein